MNQEERALKEKIIEQRDKKGVCREEELKGNRGGEENTTIEKERRRRKQAYKELKHKGL